MNPSRSPARPFTRARWFAVLITVHTVHIAALLASLASEAVRRWRMLRRDDRGVESVEVAVAIAIGLALALLLWSAYKVLIEKYIDQVQ